MSSGKTAGTTGWLLLAAYVLAWDSLASESLSRAYWRGLDNKLARWPVLFATAWVLSHLLVKRPAKILVRW